MKRTYLLSTVLLVLTLGFMAFAPAKIESSDSKLNYFTGTYEEAIAKAKEENKMVFMDSYTDWCGWCKQLDKRTFSDQEVADYMNKHFVILKMDMESPKGEVLGKKFNVRSYPTLLFIDATEKVTHRIDGFLPAKEMLAEAEMAQGKFENSK